MNKLFKMISPELSRKPLTSLSAGLLFVVCCFTLTSLLLIYPLPSQANSQSENIQRATQLLYAGIQKFAPCNISRDSLRNDCLKGCSERCLIELKPTMNDKADGECSKICQEHCQQLVSQSHSAKCDPSGALNDMSQAEKLDPNNPNTFINKAYVKIKLAKDQAFDSSDEPLAIKTLNSALSDGQKAKQLFSALNDANGVNMSENAITVIQNNILFLKKTPNTKK